MDTPPTDVRFRKALPPEHERARWNGFAPGRTLLAAGSQHTPGGRRLSCDIILDRDVPITLRDGTTVFVDIYRPDTSETLPAILAWSPYGKQGGYQDYDIFEGNAGVPLDAVSGLEKFEGPDPAFWCAHGYAIVNADPRGAFESEGDIQMFSPQDAEDGYDVIEELASLPWCDGRVAMAGDSWLASTQWAIASLRPPSLVAIAPWEGHNDYYRDVICRGGIPAPDFAEWLISGNFGRNGHEDLPAMLNEQSLLTDYWRSKRTDGSAIDVPAYVVASYTNTIHPRGTLEAFSNLKPEKSWLRIHNTHEWQDFYAYEEDLLRFFDAVIKQVDNDWMDTPRVRVSVLNPGGTDIVDRPESEWPLKRARATAFHLDAMDRSLSTTPPPDNGTATYEATQGTAAFTLRLDEDLEIVGPSRLRVWVEAEGSDDLDLYVIVQKLSAEGEALLVDTLPGVRVPVGTGQLRASHRELDDELSTPLAPMHSHAREKLLTPGEIVPLDIGLWPFGMKFQAGEQLQIVLSGHDLRTRYLNQGETTTRNSGNHHIHTGGPYDSHLLAPVVPV